ncbi:hypothetical protein [Phocaeicola vulgatus]
MQRLQSNTGYDALRTLPAGYEIHSSEQDFPTGVRRKFYWINEEGNQL